MSQTGLDDIIQLQYYECSFLSHHMVVLRNLDILYYERIVKRKNPSHLFKCHFTMFSVMSIWNFTLTWAKYRRINHARGSGVVAKSYPTEWLQKKMNTLLCKWTYAYLSPHDDVFAKTYQLKRCGNVQKGKNSKCVHLSTAEKSQFSDVKTKENCGECEFRN